MADDQGKPPRKPRSKPTYGAEPPEQPDDDYERPGNERESVEAHAEFLARYYGGGVEATPDLLDRSMDVWQRLPGAVVRGPAQIRPNRPASPAGGYEDADAAS